MANLSTIVILLVLITISYTRALPFHSNSRQQNTTAKPIQTPLNIPELTNNTLGQEEKNRTFYPPVTVVSPPIYYNSNSPPNHYPPSLMKERPPIPPPPYPLHMIERWQSYYGFNKPYSDNRPPQHVYYSTTTKDPFGAYTSRPSWWKPTGITERPQLITKPRPTISTLLSTTVATVINNHKNPSHTNTQHTTISSTLVEIRDTTKTPLTVEGKPVTIFLPSATPITKVSSAKKKPPTVIFSRPITVVHPERYVNTTIHSNLIVAQKPRPNFPQRRPAANQGQRPNRPSSATQAYVAIQPPIPFLAPIIVPTNTFSMMITGIQALNNFVRSTVWSTIAFFIPSAILALGLYAAGNRDDSIDLPPVPAFTARKW